MDRFNKKYRISSARLQSYDYASEGIYYITICTKNREHYFGKISNEEMNRNELGNIVEEEWIKTPEIRPDMNLELGEFIVMPNHFHGIIYIGQNDYNAIPSQNKFAPQSKNLASILRGFKSSVTTYVRKNKMEFDWQSRFHDHIVRTDGELNRISEYIRNNPKNWKDDEFNT